MWMSQSGLSGWSKLDKRMNTKEETIAELVLRKVKITFITPILYNKRCIQEEIKVMISSTVSSNL